MLGTVGGEQQRLRTRSNIRVGTFHTAKQQLANRHTKHSTARLARDHAFAPLRLNIRTQSFDLRGFADAVDAFKGDEYALHIFKLCDARDALSLLTATHSPPDCVSCGVRNATAAHCYEQPTGLSVLKGDEYALHIHHRAGTTAGRV